MALRARDLEQLGAGRPAATIRKVDTMQEALRTLFLRDLDSIRREVELYPDDDVLWKTIPGISNSSGNLALHAAGNLLHFIGGILGETGYVRNRDAEFSRRSGTRKEVMDEVSRAREVVGDVLGRLTVEDLARPYPEVVNGRRFITGDFLLHLSTHLAFHLGQAGYLRRAVTGDATSSGAVSNAVLASREDSSFRSG